MKKIATTIKSKDLVDKKREQIVLAAIKLFSKKGFHKTSLRELAEEFGISHGNIYDYIGTKEDILYLLDDFIISLSDDSVSRDVQHIDDPLEKLRQMMRNEFNIMYYWDNAILLIYQESHILSKDSLKILLQKERKHIFKYEVVLEECIKKGFLVDCNTRLIANLIKVMMDA